MAATDRFSFYRKQNADTISGPMTHLEAVTPSDSVELTNVSRMIYVGVGGNLKVKTVEDNEVTLVVYDGQWLDIAVKQVFATGTTATYIVAGD